MFRPKVSGSITKSQLKAKLEARKAAETDPEKAAAIDVDRALTTSDLAVSDCTVSIEVDLPKSWNTDFQKQATLKRVKSSTTDSTDSTDDSDPTNETPTGGDNTGGNTGGNDNGGGLVDDPDGD